LVFSTDESEATTSFLALLSTWDKAELDEKLANRVLVSQRAVAKLIRAFDRLLQRNEKVTLALKGSSDDEGGEVANLEEAIKQVNAEIQAENSKLHVLNTSLHEKNHGIALKVSLYCIISSDHGFNNRFFRVTVERNARAVDGEGNGSSRITESSGRSRLRAAKEAASC